MFCFQCGTKMTDGASFCPKCGAKQVDAKPLSEEKTEAPYEKDASPVVQKTPEELCSLLEAEMLKHPEIQSTKIWGDTIRIQGKTRNHSVQIANGTAKITSTLSFPYKYLKWLPWIICLIAVLSAMKNEMRGFGFDIQDFLLILISALFALLPFCLFIMGLLTAFLPSIGHKERASIKEYVRRITEPEGISLTTNELDSTTRLVISVGFIVVGIFGIAGFLFA